MKNLIYILSNDFDYDTLIHQGTSGPGYASSFGWKYDYFSNIHLYLDKNIIIDGRHSVGEFNRLQQLIISSPSTTFFICATDPSFDRRDKPFYRFAFSVARYSNVYCLFKYQPEELTEELQKLSGTRCFTLNYAYQSELCIDRPIKQRKRKIIVSGYSNTLYPYRSMFLSIRKNPLKFMFSEQLPHPGYSDVGNTLTHNIIGSRYIDYLSNFKLMLVTPSRLGLELLKYKECAYAGCVPVGVPPKTFTNDMKAPFITLDFDKLTLSTIKAILKSDKELEDRAQAYRKAFQDNRNPQILNQNFQNHLGQIKVNAL
jgi:hypothetical protein